MRASWAHEAIEAVREHFDEEDRDRIDDRVPDRMLELVEDVLQVEMSPANAAGYRISVVGVFAFLVFCLFVNLGYRDGHTVL